MLAVCNPWGWGWGGWVTICTCSYKTKLYIFNSSAANHSWWCSSWFSVWFHASRFVAFSFLRHSASTVCIHAVDLFLFRVMIIGEAIRQYREQEERLGFTTLCCPDGGDCGPFHHPCLGFFTFSRTFCMGIHLCVCVCTRWPQLRLHLASNSVCLTATGSHLWPLGCPLLQSPHHAGLQKASLHPSPFGLIQFKTLFIY